MNEDESIEQIRFAIGRYDHFYESVNTKGNLYLALNALLIGGIATSYPILDQKINFSVGHNLVFMLMILLCSASLCCTIAAINPFTRSGQRSGNISLIFFGQVAQLDSRFFARRFIKRSKAMHIQDMLSQMHVLAVGLCLKFGRLKWAGWLLSSALIVLVLSTLFLIVKNLN